MILNVVQGFFFIVYKAYIQQHQIYLYLKANIKYFEMCIVNFLDALLGQSSVFKYTFPTLSSIRLEYNYIGNRNIFIR